MLKIESLPSFLSPSSLIAAERMPNKFYLSRLIKDKVEREQQFLAAAVGSAFDYYIKLKLMEKFPDKRKYLEELKKGIETNITEAFRWGKNAYDIYTMLAFDENEIHDIEIHNNICIEHRGVKIPLYGKLDASAYYKLKQLNMTIIIPFDWKLSGYTSIDTISPHPGYYWSCENGLMLKGKHKNYHEKMSFENINKDWAVQLCTYGWLLGIKPGTPFPARVDMLCFGRQNKLTIVKYCGWITTDFQERVALRYHNIWVSIMSGDFINRLVSKTDDNLVWLKSKDETWWENKY